MNGKKDTLGCDPSTSLPPDKTPIKDVVGELMARLGDAEADLRAERSADLGGLDAQIAILTERVRNLPRKDAKSHVPSLEKLHERFETLERLAERKNVEAIDDSSPETKPNDKKSKDASSDTDDG